jgi:hypothetical protein
MKLPHRRQFLHLAAGAAALPFAPHSVRAQTVPPKTGTRLITLGTGAGPFPRPHQAQSSNLLIVIGTIFITHHRADRCAPLQGGAQRRRLHRRYSSRH